MILLHACTGVTSPSRSSLCDSSSNRSNSIAGTAQGSWSAPRCGAWLRSEAWRVRAWPWGSPACRGCIVCCRQGFSRLMFTHEHTGTSVHVENGLRVCDLQQNKVDARLSAVETMGMRLTRHRLRSLTPQHIRWRSRTAVLRDRRDTTR